ncbi:hypothetical protein LCGC14_0744730 [marine sediment metagenome]|uniref:Uncharacterized protein n=1 Tax=marine sediment metagenome TaxID=412755 RepID=A0A0F9SQT9_9ZZZZ
MSEYFKNLKSPIENILLFIGSVFIALGFITLFFAIPMLFGSLYNGWPWTITGSILLSIGASLNYLEVKLSKINIK